MAATDTILDGLVELYQADAKVLSMALREMDKHGDSAPSVLGESLMHLSRAAADGLTGDIVRSKCLAQWLKSKIEHIDSDGWRKVAKDVITYADYKRKLASLGEPWC